MNRCVTDIEFGTEWQEIRCFPRKKIKDVSTMLKNIVSDVSLSCLSWMRWAMKVSNWTKLVLLGATMLGRQRVFVSVVVSWILGLNVACRVCSTMIMTRLKEALWLWHDSSQSCGWTIFENSFRRRLYWKILRIQPSNDFFNLSVNQNGRTDYYIHMIEEWVTLWVSLISRPLY